MEALKEKLDAALKECDQLRKENSTLRELIRQAGIPLQPPQTEIKKHLSVSTSTIINTVW